MRNQNTLHDHSPHTAISAFLRAIHPEIEDEALTEYVAAFEERTYKRKTIITREGQTQKQLLFVTEGIQKSYFLHDGKEHVMAFTYAPSFSGIPESFVLQNPSRYFLETITDTRVLQISYQKHQALMQKYRSVETLFRVATEHILDGLVERHHELMAYDMETRVRHFLKRSPKLLNAIPQKDIASYLRINPTNLSKLLGKSKNLV